MSFDLSLSDVHILTLLFSGIIPHSARPPSRNFTGARLSFAVKLSNNERVGRIKASREELRHLSAALSTLYFIKRQYLRESDEGTQFSILVQFDLLRLILQNSDSGKTGVYIFSGKKRRLFIFKMIYNYIHVL